MTLKEFIYDHDLDMVYDLIFRYGVRNGFLDQDGNSTASLSGRQADNEDIEVVTDPRDLLSF